MSEEEKLRDENGGVGKGVEYWEVGKEGLNEVVKMGKEK